MLVVASGAFAKSVQLPVDLTVTEPAGTVRQDAPVSGGVPLPWGVYKADQQFTLYEDGKEIPVQTTPLVVDGDGFLRWVLVNANIDLGAGEKKILTLRAARPSVQSSVKLKIKEMPDGIAVDTGKIQFLISKDKPFSVFDAVISSGDKVVTGGAVSYTDGTGNPDDQPTYQAEAPSEVTLEYAGPLRTTIRARGGFEGDDDLGWICRITAWAGRSDVHIKYSLVNSNPDHYTYRLIKDSTIRLDLASPVEKTIFGRKDPLALDGTGWMHVGLVTHQFWQDIKGHTRIGQKNEVVWSGNGPKDKTRGWMAAKLSSERSLFVGDLFFEENPARRLETGENAIKLTGVAEIFEGYRDAKFNQDKPPEKRRIVGRPYSSGRAPYTKWRWLPDCSHLSSEYVLDFDAGDALEKRNRAARRPLQLVAPLAWYNNTDAFAIGKFASQKDELKVYEKWGWNVNKSKAPEKPGLNVGRYIMKEDNHFETEQDTLEAFIMMYLRTGDYPFFVNAQAWANYEMDLQKWRTDGFRFKAGCVWWASGGPSGGNMPTRAKDPVTGLRNHTPVSWNWKKKGLQPRHAALSSFMNGKQCYCHPYGAGMAAWYCLTGERDAYDAAIDSVEQVYDMRRDPKRGGVPGKRRTFSRNHSRANYVAHSVRMIAPSDPFVIKASEWLMNLYLKRPDPEPRGLAHVSSKTSLERLATHTFGKGKVEKTKALMKESGVRLEDGYLVHEKTGSKWKPVFNPQTWMHAPWGLAMDCYYRQTGDETAMDHLIALGQSTAYVLHQNHHNISYPHEREGGLVVDFPLKGVARDGASWRTGNDPKAKGAMLSGYIAGFWADMPARAYAYTGEPTLLKRAYDLWHGHTHRGYRSRNMSASMSEKTGWVNVYGPHDEKVRYSARLFHEWAGHPRSDMQPPNAVSDLLVRVQGSKAIVSFSAPADASGQVVRYQIKAADKPIVDYKTFLQRWKEYKAEPVVNWWMADNLDGEPAPAQAGQRVRFSVDIPETAAYFAIRSFDDSGNRSELSNVVAVK